MVTMSARRGQLHSKCPRRFKIVVIHDNRFLNAAKYFELCKKRKTIHFVNNGYRKIHRFYKTAKPLTVFNLRKIKSSRIIFLNFLKHLWIFCITNVGFVVENRHNRFSQPADSWLAILPLRLFFVVFIHKHCLYVFSRVPSSIVHNC